MILAGYAASWLMAGAILAIGAAVSALTKNQVIAFIVTAAAGFRPDGRRHLDGARAAARLGPRGRHRRRRRAPASSGISRRSPAASWTLRDLVYFLSLIVAFLAANAILVDLKKAD